MSENEYEQGDTVRIENTVEKTEPFDDTKSLTNTDTSEIKIENPDGDEILSYTAMTKSETGKYYYNFNIPTDSKTGWWKVTIKNVKGSINDYEYYYFKVTSS